MEQAAAHAPMVQILDIPVPQMVEQLPDVLRFFATLLPVPEQVIEEPKIPPEDVQFRAVLRDTQLAEQLVEVPTIISYSSLQLNMEQNVDIPVPCRGGRNPGLQDRVQQRRSCLWNAFLSGLRSRSLIFLFLVEASKIFAQNRVHPLLRMFQPAIKKAWMSLVKGVLALFPKFKKSAKWGLRSSQRVPASASPSTPAPQHRVRLKQWVMILNEHGLYFWNKDTEGKRWQMEEGYNPRWWLRDGQYVDLGDLAF